MLALNPSQPICFNLSEYFHSSSLSSATQAMSISPSVAALAAVAAWNISLEALLKAHKMRLECKNKGSSTTSYESLSSSSSAATTSDELNDANSMGSKIHRAIDSSTSDLGILFATLMAVHMQGKSTTISDPLAKLIIIARVIRSGSHLLGNGEFIDKLRCLLGSAEKGMCGYMLLRLFNWL